MTIPIDAAPTPAPTSAQPRFTAIPSDAATRGTTPTFSELLDRRSPTQRSPQPGPVSRHRQASAGAERPLSSEGGKTSAGPGFPVTPAAFVPIDPDRQLRFAANALSGAPAHRFDAFGMFGYAGAVAASHGDPVFLPMSVFQAAPWASGPSPVSGEVSLDPLAQSQSPLSSTTIPRAPTLPMHTFHPWAVDRHGLEAASGPNEIIGNVVAPDEAEDGDVTGWHGATCERSASPPPETAGAGVNLTISGENGALGVVARSGESDPQERDHIRRRIEAIAAEYGCALASLHLDGLATIPTSFSIGTIHGR